eukprot:g1837.t1
MSDLLLLRCESSGKYLAVSDNSVLSTQSYAGDEAMWREIDGSTLVSATRGDLRLKRSQTTGGQFTLHLEGDGGVSLDAHGSSSDSDAALFTVHRGPVKLPSAYVDEMERTGYTVLDGVLQPEALRDLEKQVQQQRTEQLKGKEGSVDGRFGLNMLCTSPLISQVAVHPVAMFVMQRYMGVQYLHHCHIPSLTVLKPARELVDTALPLHARGAAAGFHADYPYRVGRFLDDEWPEHMRLGVQYNVCVSAFRKDNGATQFIPNSHLIPHAPPHEVNEALAVPADTVQLEAPAGAAFIYDSRLWHRACPELNVSGEDRIAILHAVTPSWIVPMVDRQAEAEAYAQSPVPAMLTPREKADMERMIALRTYNGQMLFAAKRAHQRQREREQGEQPGGGGRAARL